LITARWLGGLADSWGKFNTLRAIALAFVLHLVGLTVLGRVGMAGALLVSTLFFVCGSGSHDVHAGNLVTAAAHNK